MVVATYCLDAIGSRRRDQQLRRILERKKSMYVEERGDFKTYVQTLLFCSRLLQIHLHGRRNLRETHRMYISVGRQIGKRSRKCCARRSTKPLHSTLDHGTTETEVVIPNPLVNHYNQ